MSDASHVARSLHERLGINTEERLGRALSELLENPLLTGAIGRAFDAREKAAQVQEVAMGALNLPSAADIERLTRRLRSVSLRLEGIEEGVDRLDRALSPTGVERSDIDQRLHAIEAHLERMADMLDSAPRPPAADASVAGAPARATVKSGAARKAGAKSRTGKAKPGRA